MEGQSVGEEIVRLEKKKDLFSGIIILCIFLILVFGISLCFFNLVLGIVLTGFLVGIAIYLSVGYDKLKYQIIRLSHGGKISGSFTAQKQEFQLSFCPSCGKQLQPDWQVCGYCGKKLKGG